MKLFLTLLLATIFLSCSDEPKKFPVMDMNKMQEQLLEANKIATSKEAQQIDEYVKSKDINLIKTKTGLRYHIYNDAEGELIKKEQIAVVKYTVTLLDGTECYSTKDEVEEFIVDKDYVETGLHEGVQFMSAGDKAILVLPSHLAHGLAGDLNISGIRNIEIKREENNKIVTYLLDLRSNNIFASPAYYLQQNDIVYVSPNKATSQSASFNKNTGLFISVGSVIISLIAILTR